MRVAGGMMGPADSSWTHHALVLLRHKCMRLFRGFLRAQQGHRGMLVASARINLRRIVAIELGAWRSGLIGGASCAWSVVALVSPQATITAAAGNFTRRFDRPSLKKLTRGFARRCADPPPAPNHQSHVREPCRRRTGPPTPAPFAAWTADLKASWLQMLEPSSRAPDGRQP
jgi:hypothetical protein